MSDMINLWGLFLIIFAWLKPLFFKLSTYFVSTAVGLNKVEMSVSIDTPGVLLAKLRDFRILRPITGKDLLDFCVQLGLNEVIFYSKLAKGMLKFK